MKYITFFFVSSVAIFLSACNATPQVENKVTHSPEPKWMNDPYVDNNTLASVGCARVHYKGKTAQKKLALSNAIDEIATQLNTTVENVTLRKQNYSAGKKDSSSLSTSSLHRVENVDVSVKLKDTYIKPNGEVCVWVVQN